MVTVSTKYLIAGSITILILLCGMLAFPLGHDQSIFQLGGNMIFKQGAIPYRDFLELKQPLIFYIYGFTNWMFGDHEWSVRLFDIFYHCITLYFFYRLLRKVYQDERIALFSIVLYTLYYTGSGYWMTSQTESFALLPTLLITEAILKFEQGSNSFGKILEFALIIGIAIFILISLKITLGLVIIAFIPIILFHSNQTFPFKIRFVCFTIIFTIGFLFLACLGLYLTGAWDNFTTSLIWINKYADIVPILSIETFKNVYFHAFPSLLVSSISLTYFVLSIIGITIHNTKYETSLKSKFLPKFFHVILFWQLAIGLFGVLFERKNFVYQYTRVVWILMPFISLAILFLYQHCKRYYRQEKNKNNIRRIYSVGLVAVILVIVLLFSPLPRVISQPVEWTWLTIRHDDNAKEAKLAEDEYSGLEIENMAKKIIPKQLAQNQLFFWGNYVHIYLSTGTLPPTLCLANPQFISPWTPKEWKQQMIIDLKNASPRFFITEYNDSRPFITGTTSDSYASLLQWDELRTYLFMNYQLLDSSRHFKIYSRIE